ncbi:MAG: glutamyl-tRNA reductase [Micrococcales bacterium]|nr:glutamyl-tRNA reductase [Micrococcales bacterium]
MSLVVMGLSHHTSPIDVLERVALDAAGAAGLAQAVLAGDNVTESVVVATCNRVEVYARVETFHGAVDDICAALVGATGMSRAGLGDHCYVHYEDRAIAHVFGLACGLDSMAVGESQILGQLRDALEAAQLTGSAGPVLNGLFQRALRVGKRAHSETDLDRAGRDLVSEGLLAATEFVGPLDRARVLIVGAGSMSALAAAQVSRARAAELTVINRTTAKAERLATSTGGGFLPWGHLEEAVGTADVVITCTGALGHVLVPDMVARARAAVAGRSSAGERQVLLDLALPRDVDPAVALLPDTRVIGLADLGRRLALRPQESDVEAVRDLVTGEVAAYLLTRRSQAVAPTVAALRGRAAQVVAAEVARFESKMPQLDDTVRTEVQRTIQRVVDKLLHTPTVRVKQLVGEDAGADYAAALRELFDLDPGEAATSDATPTPGVTR